MSVNTANLFLCECEHPDVFQSCLGLNAYCLGEARNGNTAHASQPPQSSIDGDLDSALIVPEILCTFDSFPLGDAPIDWLKKYLNTFAKPLQHPPPAEDAAPAAGVALSSARFAQKARDPADGKGNMEVEEVATDDDDAKSKEGEGQPAPKLQRTT